MENELFKDQSNLENQHIAFIKYDEDICQKLLTMQLIMNSTNCIQLSHYLQTLIALFEYFLR